MPTIALSFNTYQDVKKNLSYWTFFLLVVSILVIFFAFLTPSQQQIVLTSILSLGITPLLGNLLLLLIVLLIYFGLGIVLTYGFQIHDAIYDKFFIRWREQYDLEVILPGLTEPIRQYLPKNFLELARRSRYQFMKPFYEFVGNGKPGIQHNTRVRFYERVTSYWATQINEIFLLAFLIGSPAYILINPATSPTITTFALFMLVLIILGFVNRWFIRITRQRTKQSTLDEIEEILSKPDNVNVLKDRFIEICKSYAV